MAAWSRRRQRPWWRRLQRSPVRATSLVIIKEARGARWWRRLGLGRPGAAVRRAAGGGRTERRRREAAPAAPRRRIGWEKRGEREYSGLERQRKYGGGKLEVSRRHSFVVRPRASACGRVARAGRHELGARQQEATQARLASGLLSLAK
uniref:Uncharacterized protein n=1 Tax=Oryza barthii TaxID=65489 RepID=A0A0D3H5P7_9ORYZ